MLAGAVLVLADFIEEVDDAAAVTLKSFGIEFDRVEKFGKCRNRRSETTSRIPQGGFDSHFPSLRKRQLAK